MEENNLDFLEKTKEISDDKLDQLSDLAHKQWILEHPKDDHEVKAMADRIPPNYSIANLEELLKIQKEKLEKIKREKIPSIMNELNLSEIKLKAGKKLTIVEQVKPSLAKKNILEVMPKMIEEEYERLFGLVDECYKYKQNLIPIREKAEANIKSLFKDKLNLECTDLNITNLLKLEIPFEKDTSIHHSTLAKYCRELLEAGRKIPDGINVFQYQETKLS